MFEECDSIVATHSSVESAPSEPFIESQVESVLSKERNQNELKSDINDQIIQGGSILFSLAQYIHFRRYFCLPSSWTISAWWTILAISILSCGIQIDSQKFIYPLDVDGGFSYHDFPAVFYCYKLTSPGVLRITIAYRSVIVYHSGFLNF